MTVWAGHVAVLLPALLACFQPARIRGEDADVALVIRSPGEEWSARQQPECTPGTAQILGTVISDTGGHPLRYANVFLPSGSATGQLNPSCSSNVDSAGRFAIGGIAGGEYLVVARAIGYEAARQTVSLRARSTATLHFRLRTIDQRRGEERLKLRAPTPVTPCWPDSPEAAWRREFTWRTLSEDPDLESDDRLASFLRDTLEIRVERIEEVELVTEARLCREAIAKMEELASGDSTDTQIYLFRVGRRHFAAWNPEDIYSGADCTTLTFLDHQFNVLVTLC